MGGAPGCVGGHVVGRDAVHMRECTRARRWTRDGRLLLDGGTSASGGGSPGEPRVSGAARGRRGGGAHEGIRAGAARGGVQQLLEQLALTLVLRLALAALQRHARRAQQRLGVLSEALDQLLIDSVAAREPGRARAQVEYDCVRSPARGVRVVGARTRRRAWVKEGGARSGRERGATR
eukprot:5646158-Prymnesium_polylepis.2